MGGRKLIKTLLEGYTSSEEENEPKDDVLDLLGGYGSDDESLKYLNLEQSFEEVDGLEELPTLEEVGDILEYVGHDAFTEDQTQWVDEVEKVETDWSDSADDEAEIEPALQRHRALH